MGKKPKIAAKKPKAFKIPEGPKVKITHKLKKKIMPKITVPKIKRKSKGGKNEKAENVEEVQPPMPEPKQEPIKLPDFLEIVESENYFASNKGRLTNQEIVDNGLEFAHTIGNVWNYRFK